MKKEIGSNRGVRLQATPAAKARYKGKIQEVAVAAIEDLKKLNKHTQSVFSHVFDFEGRPVVVATQVSRDNRNVFVDLDIGDGIPRKTIMQSDVPRRSRAEAEFSRIAKNANQDEEQEDY